MLTLAPHRFLVLGHRGASAHAPENSVAAFRLAAEQGADGVELDVRRTADGALVVHHDAVVPAVGAIVDLTLTQLREQAPTVITFAEAMAACRDLIVNVEIKNSPLDPDFDPDDRLAEAVVEWVTENGWADGVVISSFNPATVNRVRHLDNGLATGQLVDPGVDAAHQLLATHQRGHRALHPHVASLSHAAALGSLAEELGMWLFAWTVDDPALVLALREAGVTGIITNDPAGALAAIGGG